MKFEWQFSTPEAEGMDINVLQELDGYLKQHKYRLVNSVLVVKNGKIVVEKYYNQFHEFSRNPIKSIWKSILAIAAGICLDKGLIQSLDEPIGTHLKEFAEDRHPFHKIITIRHLLTMSSGIYWNGGVHYHTPMMQQMMRTNDWINHIADIEMDSVPGRTFHYKEWDVMLLSAIIGKVYGGTSYDLVQEFLYKPLEIISDEWPQSPCGFSYTVMKGEEKSDLSARDLAKIGLLMLGEGTFNGHRIISSDFTKQIINPSFENNSQGSLANNQFYGYLWWLTSDGYHGRGFGGQELNIVPESNYISVVQATPSTSSKAYGDINENILMKAIL
ncbi:serine hydrolase [Heyndrickxia shackletonii]|uniref:Serine hydrolase n=1 Tax=Heyndrickxia shackletonii TaxID=157838 RepID=A0A0Q3WYQ6_9BACI|nr:serine hydrolase domain-containing protein [Heyndrickxia shackletonii]KQL54443.1 serine hydrolase [Heyndrickxia shackletonii]NEY99166.1 beta-lactamase family protein [Heyndrickxia shackletonii]